MEMIRQPLHQSEEDNRRQLQEAERRLRAEGSEFGNRQQRRLAARTVRKAGKRERVTP